MTAFAADTSVPIARSKVEIENLIARYGASGFGVLVRPEGACVMFEAHNRTVRFVLMMPGSEDSRFLRSPQGRLRTKDQAKRAYEQEIRRLWRCLVLVIKAKLEAVQSGIVTFEEEFLAYTVLPSGRTVAEEVEAPLKQQLSGHRVLLLPGREEVS